MNEISIQMKYFMKFQVEKRGEIGAPRTPEPFYCIYILSILVFYLKIIMIHYYYYQYWVPNTLLFVHDLVRLLIKNLK